MWFAILGPLLVHDGETLVDVPKGRQRVLLAALLLHAGKPVSADTLAEVVWDGAPPPGAEVTLRSHVLRLRRVLGPRAGARLVTRFPGYLLQAEGDEVDLLRFRCLCRDGGGAARAGVWGRAHVLLGEALDLWRGAPLADIPSESLRQDHTQDLETLRLQAEEWRIDAALHLGGHAELVSGLHSLIAQHPLRERFHGQLMLALYRCGRQAEALAAYQHARYILIEELGSEPGPELQDLHQRILSVDPALGAAGPTPQEPTGPARITPRELPPTVPGFTGRSAELQALTQLLDRSRTQGAEAIVISAIGGTAGVGKTALAVHWAHQAARRFPDGQLYVNLRGYDPGRPMPAGDALAGFLHSLGVPGREIPLEPEQRAACYRSILAGKQMLIVLDNAGSADQVRPLLPGTPTCTVVVTSRDSLAGLVARDGAARLDLDVLPSADAVALLRTLIGPRAAADAAAAAKLAGQCCWLPLALRVAAEFAVSRPDMPLAGLAAELADLSARLDLLDAGGDARTQVRAVFSWSYRHLDAEAAPAFRLAGLHPGPDLEPYAAAALTGATVPQARRALDAVARAHLIQPAGPGRYGMHDLLREYARELSATVDGAQEQHAALTRLFDYYLHTAATAVDTLYPAERHRRPRIPRLATPVPQLGDPATAQEWLDGQRAALVATAAHGWPGYATRLAAILSSYLDSGGHYAEALIVYNHALGAARRTGDHASEAMTLNQIGLIDWYLNRPEQAADHFRQALALFREAGDRPGEAHALSSVGLGEIALGSYEQAVRHHQEAIAIFRHVGDSFGEARTLGLVGFTRHHQRRYQEAAGYHQQALDLSREIGDREGEALALDRLGIVSSKLGCYQHAAGYFQQALAIYRERGNAEWEGTALFLLGGVHLELAQYQQAAADFEQALAILLKTADPATETSPLNNVGDVLSRISDTDTARVHYAACLRIQARAAVHQGLARAYHGTGDALQARHHWKEALTR